MTLEQIKKELVLDNHVEIGNYMIMPRRELIVWCDELFGMKKSYSFCIYLRHRQTKYYDCEIKFDNAIKRLLKKLNK
jgi:hypothetical protein